MIVDKGKNMSVRERMGNALWGCRLVGVVLWRVGYMALAKSGGMIEKK